MKNWSIKIKVWIAIGTVAFAVISCILSLTYYLYDRLYVDKQIEFLLQQGNVLADVYAQNGDNHNFTERLAWMQQSLEATVLFSDDPMELSSGAPFDPYIDEHLITFEERQQLLEGETVVMVRAHPRFAQDILGSALPVFTDGKLAGAILLSMPLSKVYEPFIDIRSALILALLLLIVIVIFIGNRISNQIARPLIEMKQIAKQMADGDFSKRIKEDERRDELGQLAVSFNFLSSALETFEQNRREFLANVSHELRTPLSHMKGYAEALQEKVIDEEKGLTIIQKEAVRLERLTNDLLDLAQLEGDSYPLSLEPIAFAQLIIDTSEPFELIAQQQKITIIRQLDHDMIIYGDSARLEQVIRNLLDNALRYTPEGRSITITLKMAGEAAVLIVADEGIGIPSQDLSEVTERFYRVNKARTREDGGTGLGLAIVSEIVKKHNGQFDLYSKLGEGTRAQVILPCPKEA